MLFLKYLLIIGGILCLLAASTFPAFYLYRSYFREVFGKTDAGPIGEMEFPDMGLAARLAAVGSLAWVLALSIVVIPSGMAGVRVSQLSGTRPGTLYPGLHFVVPLLQNVAMFDVREKVFSAATEGKDKQTAWFNVVSREGLTLGLEFNVRYRVDAHRLDYIENNVPQPVDEEVVRPIVASTLRDIAPNYTVKEIFATDREAFRRAASDRISQRLGEDGIVLRELMLRDVQLPPEYARGMEDMLVKEQENDTLDYETEIKQKQVKIAELEAEANKAQQIQAAEGQAQVRVLQAKGESDAMQYLLPLKQKQIEQTRLEAEAKKETTVQDAEAAAEAKVIDSKAELQRRNLLADAEANRIRVVSSADTERMRAEAVALKENPLLINKIIAERLSDKIQIMMVPTDGKFFFGNDVLRGFNAPTQQPEAAQEFNSDPAKSDTMTNGAELSPLARRR